MRRDLIVLAIFTLVAAFYLRPLLSNLSTRIGPDAGDPTLNASVLAWNATVAPLTTAWWNQPWFFPASGVAAFTENLLGLAPISTPIYWLTRDPIVTYNLTFFLMWPLSAFAMYWCVRRLTGRADAGIVAGFAFGFTPYRTSVELGHLQSLAVFWLPVAIGALHAYFQSQRRWWLVLFGVAWVMQALANGYYMLFGAVLVALWLAYFGATKGTWRLSLHAAAAWALSSLALVPILVGYHRIHDYYGLHRTLEEARAFSAQADSWVNGSGLLRFWRDVLPSGQEILFPGLTVVLLVCVGLVVALSARKTTVLQSRRRAVLQAALAILALVSLLAVFFWLSIGTWSVRFGGQTWLRVSEPSRALLFFAICAAVLSVMAPVKRAVANRRPLVFYVVVTVLMALLACGPVVTVRGQVLLETTPYRWLMALPGFDELRVPSRFWMMGVFCLTVAAGLAYARVARAIGFARHVVFVLVVVGILADGWLTSMPMASAPELWTTMAGSDASLPLLELPIGPGADNPPTIRTTVHHRRVFNGVSGYDPPHYAALVEGLRARDPQMLRALGQWGPYEISIERTNDRDETWQRYVESAPTAQIVAHDQSRVIYRVTPWRVEDFSFGRTLPVVMLQSTGGDASAVLDGRVDTEWANFPQHVNQWLLADLGASQSVSGVRITIGDHPLDFPRQLRIETSVTGEKFETVWEGNGAPLAFRAFVEAPRTGRLRIAFEPIVARFVRITELAEAPNAWRVAELEIHGPGANR